MGATKAKEAPPLEKTPDDTNDSEVEKSNTEKPAAPESVSPPLKSDTLENRTRVEGAQDNVER